MKAVNKVQGRKRFAVNKLKQPEVHEAFKLELRNIFLGIENEDEEKNTNEKFENIKDCL